jgi:hypothetical protein
MVPPLEPEGRNGVGAKVEVVGERVVVVIDGVSVDVHVHVDEGDADGDGDGNGEGMLPDVGAADGFEEKIVQVSRVSKKTKGGNKIGFSVLIVVAVMFLFRCQF